MKTDKQIENCISSELENFLGEFEAGVLTKQDFLQYVGSILIDSEMDSRITVNVMNQFGEEGKEVSMWIKVTEGW